MDTTNPYDSPDVAPRPDPGTLADLYRTMVRIRRFEEQLSVLFKRGRLPGFVHLYTGQEGVATGVCSVLRREDRITSTHRGHGHLIAKGADINGMMAELFGKVGGLCRGKGGSMHTVDFSLGIIGTNGIVGGGIPIAVGAAWSAKQLGQDHVAVAFFGDGASNQGVLLESMNLAQIWRLPVIFVCEANGYSEWTATEKLTAGRIADRGVALGIPGRQIDGNDVLEVRAVTDAAVARARAGEGPTLIEACTMRWHGHNEGEEAFSGNYRPADEVDSWQERDPVAALRVRLETWQTHDLEELDAIWTEEGRRVEAAVAFAEDSPLPDPEEALQDVFFAADDNEKAVL